MVACPKGGHVGGDGLMDYSRIPTVNTDVSSSSGKGQPGLFEEVEFLLVRMAMARKARLLYPAEHPAAGQSASMLHAALCDFLLHDEYFIFGLVPDGLLFEDRVIGIQQDSLHQLHERLHALNVHDLTIGRGVTPTDLAKLLELLTVDPEVVESQGGAETYLFILGADHIRITESAARRREDRPVEENETDASGCETALAGFADHIRELVELMRNDRMLGAGIEGLCPMAVQDMDNQQLAGTVFSFLCLASAFIESEHAAESGALHRCLAEGLLFLKPEIRNLLLLKYLFPRIKEERGCARIAASFTEEELAGVLYDLLLVMPELLSRTVPLLHFMGLGEAEAGRVLQQLRQSLLVSGGFPSDLLTGLQAGDHWRDEQAEEEVTVPQQVRKLPTLDEIARFTREYEPGELDRLQRIAAMDLRDEVLAETTPMLLDLLQRGAELDNLPAATEMLQRCFWDSLASGQFQLAADIVERCRTYLAGDRFGQEKVREHLEEMLSGAAGAYELTPALNLAYQSRQDPCLLQGFQRYLGTLQSAGVESLLVLLASEENRSMRKFMHDRLVQLGEECVETLGRHVHDANWWLVRNILSVMALVHSPSCLRFLQQTLQHPDPRLSAATVRALGMVGGHDACEILRSGLDNPHERTRLLCVRWLGRLGDAKALHPLARMLETRGEKGNDLALKREIVESIGRIGTLDALPILERYSRLRKLVRRSEWDEINRTASAGLERLHRRFPHLARRRWQ